MGIEDIKLLVTDLDGTLIGNANEFPLYDSFKEHLDSLHSCCNTRWMACTGRTYRSFSEFFYPIQSMGIMPDYIIVRHAYILVRTKIGYLPLIFWNLHIFHIIWQQKLQAREVLKHWRGMITGASAGVKVVEQEQDKLWLRFNSEEAANTAADLLSKNLSEYKHLKVFQSLKEVVVRPVPFTKGLAVLELAKYLNLENKNILAIGNGHNDISMFSEDVALFTGCPVNSEAEVMRVVHERGGHIAEKSSLGGVLEILDSYKENKINSSLPAWWVPPPKSINNHSHHSSTHRKSKKQLYNRSLFLFLGVVYVALIVFAHFELIPFSEYILKPFSYLSKGVDYLLSAFYSK